MQTFQMRTYPPVFSVVFLQLVEEEQELRHRLHLQGLYLEARRLGVEVKEELGADGTAGAGHR